MKDSESQFSKKRLRTIKILFSLIFLLLIPLWMLTISKEILKLPADFSLTAEVISIDNFYDDEISQYLGDQYSISEFGYKTLKAESDSLIIENYFDVRTADNEPIFRVKREYGINRYDGSHISTLSDKSRTGYLFAPRSIKKGESFTYWHVNYDGPAVMNYVGEEEIDGLILYRYVSDYSGTSIDQTANLSQLEGVGITKGIIVEPELEIWIEPVTGLLVKYQDKSNAYFYDLNTREILSPWNSFSNRTTEESNSRNLELAQIEKIKFRVVNIIVPILLALIAFSPFLLFEKEYKRLIKRLPYRSLSVTLGIMLLTFSVVVLGGWLLDIEPLIRLGLPKAATINPMTLVLYGLIGALPILSRQRSNFPTAISAGVIVVISSLRTVFEVDAINWRIDEVLFTDMVLNLNAQMAFVTSIAFLTLGLSLLITRVQSIRNYRVPEILILAILILSSLFLVDYLSEPLGVVILPRSFGVPFATSALMVLASGLVLSVVRLDKRAYLSPRSNLLIFAIFFTSLALTTAFANTIVTNSREQAESEFNSSVDSITEELLDSLATYVNVLQGSEGFLTSTDFVNRDKWRSYIESLSIEENYPGIQAIGYSELIRPEDLARHEQSIKSEGYLDYAVHPQGDREIYSAIVYIEPFSTRNQQAFGFDMFQEPTRHNAMQRARDNAEPNISGAVTLLQETDTDIQPGFLIYVPHYSVSRELLTSEEERQDAILGYTYAAFRSYDFTNSVLQKNQDSEIGLRIDDGIGMSDETVLFDDLKLKSINPNLSRFRSTETIYIYGRPWTLSFYSSEDFGATPYNNIAAGAVLLIGVSVSFLISFIVFTIINSRQTSIEYAEEVTRNLKRAKAKDEALLLSIGDGLVATDRAGKITLVNQEFEKLLGWSEEEVLGKKLVDIVKIVDENGELIDTTKRPLTTVLKDSKKRSEINTQLIYKRKNGSKLHCSVTVTPIIEHGKVSGAVEVFRDITQEKLIDRAKTEFVSLASHQLRTPLTTINWYTELLSAEAGKKFSPKQREYFNEISLSSRRMADLVEALLNVSRIELGTFAITPKPTDMISLMKSVLVELKPLIAKKKLNMHIPEVKLPLIPVDPNLFRMVYQNLITNAVKYTPDNGKITILHKVENKKLRIEVQDTGFGIPEDQKGDIFKKLFRADNVMSKDTQGTGLGLYIVKSIIEESEGRIWFDSEENVGTTFYVEIPLKGMKPKNGSKMLE